ncbi:MAG: hypothetical protein HOP23_07915 [Methylococcaceae bacterium]|nr:hypothetical protein [Methylococcaceae bacterium]
MNKFNTTSIRPYIKKLGIDMEALLDLGRNPYSTRADSSFNMARGRQR